MFYMAIFHSKPEYMASNENLGLQLSVESMINTLACLVSPYGQAKIAYFHSENLPRFGMKIFENLILSSNTSNMYIKWKLKSYWIQIWQKNHFSWKNFEKQERKFFFGSRIFEKKDFKCEFFRKFFFQPQFFFFHQF